MLRRINDCNTIIRRQRNDQFLKRIVTGHEKWAVYNNVKRKTSWSKKDKPAQITSKPVVHQKKLCCPFGGIPSESFILSFCRDNTTINSEVYYNQEALKEKRSELVNRKGVVFHQDNASLITRQKLLQHTHHILQTWHIRTITCSGI